MKKKCFSGVVSLVLIINLLAFVFYFPGTVTGQNETDLTNFNPTEHHTDKATVPQESGSVEQVVPIGEQEDEPGSIREEPVPLPTSKEDIEENPDSIPIDQSVKEKAAEAPAFTDHVDDVLLDEYIIKFKDADSVRKANEMLQEKTIEIKKDLPLIDGKLIKLHPQIEGPSSEETIQLIRANPLVEYIEPNYRLYPLENTPTPISDDPGASNLWGLKNYGQIVQGTVGNAGIDINLESAWTVTDGSSDVVVAVIDTGVDIQHPDLVDRIWTNTAEVANGQDDDGNGYIDDIHGWDFFHGDSTVFDPIDRDEHGTHCSGTIAATRNTIGVVGVAPKVKIMPLKFIGPDGGSTSNAILAIDYARRKGVKISSNSWGGGGYSQALYDAIANSGMLFVAAAGNDGVNNDNNPHYPSSYNLNNILSVAAIDNRGYLADFSNYGVQSVDVGAPGVSIYSTLPGDTYGYFSGTSMATPHVSGIAALAFSAGFTDPLVVKDLILNSAQQTPLTSLSNKVLTGGLANAGLALPVSPVTGVTVSPDNVSLHASQTVKLTANVQPANARNRNVYWVSNNENIALIDAEGNLTGIGVGQTTITVTTQEGGFSTQCAVTVLPSVRVTGVSLDKNELTLAPGAVDSAVLTATVEPQNATNTGVSWVSSNTNIVTVEQAGTVSAISNGQATVTVTTADGGFSDSCVITVKDAVHTDIYVQDFEVDNGGFLVEGSNPSWQWGVPTSDPGIAYSGEKVWGTNLAGNYNDSEYSYITSPSISLNAASINRLSLSWAYWLSSEYNYDFASVYISKDNGLNWEKIFGELSGASQGWIVQQAQIDSSYAVDQFKIRFQFRSDYSVSRPGFYIDQIKITTSSLNSIPVSGVRLSQSELNIYSGQTEQLNALIEPVNATNRNVIWQSSNQGIAQVDQNGLVTAISPGQCEIRVTTEEGGFTAACSLNVLASIPVSGVQLNQNNLELVLALADSAKLLATVLPEEATCRNVTWQSDNPSIAAVDQEGNVHAIAAGNTTITVTTQEGEYSATCTVTVREPVISEIYSEDFETSDGGYTVGGSNASWQCGIPTSGPGTAYSGQHVWATNLSGNYNHSENSYIMSPIIDLNIDNNGQVTLNWAQWLSTESGWDFARLDISNDGGNTWQTVYGEVSGTVDNGWTVKEVPLDSLYHTSQFRLRFCLRTDGSYSYSGYYIDKVKICVKSMQTIPVTGIELQPQSLELLPGQQSQIIAQILPGQATNKHILWASDNPSIAQVDQQGLVTARAAGNATISATTEDGGFVDTCSITVLTPVAVSGISLDQSNLVLVQGLIDTAQLTATVQPENATNKNVYWQSSNNSVAEVNQTGQITVLGLGNAIITATTEDGGYSASCNVNVIEAYRSDVYFENFEMNDGSYTTGGTNCSWQWGVPASGVGPGQAYNSTYCWGTNLTGNYNTSENSYLTSPAIDLTMNSSDRLLVKWAQWVNTESNYDFIAVEASKDGGYNWETIFGPVSGAQSSWQIQEAQLSNLEGVGTIYIRFNLRTDGSVVTSGFYVDNIEIIKLSASSDIVSFTDASLEQAVREALGKAEGDITAADMVTITNLLAASRGIENLEGLQYASKLQYLDLYNNKIIDIANLGNMNRLQRLDLSHNMISDITSLSALSNLSKVYLQYNMIDLQTGSNSYRVIQELIQRMVDVEYQPQGNSPPTVIQVGIMGTLKVGDVLYGRYSYSDPDNDPENNSRYQWYRSDSAYGPKQVIAEATAINYILTPEDRNKYIFFEVIPVADTGIKEGTAVISNGYGPVADGTPSATPLKFLSVRVGSDSSGAELLNDFNKNITDYDMQIDSAVQQLLLSVVPSEGTNVTANFNGEPLASNVIDLNGNGGIITILVQQPNYKDLTYTINIRQEQADHCFIATAAFGSKYSGPVALLRHFRDQFLLTSNLGRNLVTFYYHVSPPIADVIALNQGLRLIVRILLAPVVALVYLIYHPYLNLIIFMICITLIIAGRVRVRSHRTY